MNSFTTLFELKSPEAWIPVTAKLFAGIYEKELLPYTDYLVLMHPDNYHSISEAAGFRKCLKTISWEDKKIPAMYNFLLEIWYVYAIADFYVGKNNFIFLKPDSGEIK